MVNVNSCTPAIYANVYFNIINNIGLLQLHAHYNFSENIFSHPINEDKYDKIPAKSFNNLRGYFYFPIFLFLRCLFRTRLVICCVF